MSYKPALPEGTDKMRLEREDTYEWRLAMNALTDAMKHLVEVRDDIRERDGSGESCYTVLRCIKDVQTCIRRLA